MSTRPRQKQTAISWFSSNLDRVFCLWDGTSWWILETTNDCEQQASSSNTIDTELSRSRRTEGCWHDTRRRRKEESFMSKSLATSGKINLAVKFYEYASIRSEVLPQSRRTFQSRVSSIFCLSVMDKVFALQKSFLPTLYTKVSQYTSREIKYWFEFIVTMYRTIPYLSIFVTDVHNYMKMFKL